MHVHSSFLFTTCELAIILLHKALAPDPKLIFLH